MDKRTKGLLIAVAALAVIYWISYTWSPRSKDRSFKQVVVALDTTAIITFRMEAPPTLGRDLRFERVPGGWTVSDGITTHKADGKHVADLLASTMPMRSKRYIGAYDILKERYGLDEASATRVTFTDLGGKQTVLLIGRGTFAPGKVGSWTYVCAPDDGEIHAMEGNLTQATERKPEDWRPRFLLRCEPEDVVRLELFDAGDGSLIDLRREGTAWTVDGMPADSLRMLRYVGGLSQASPRTFHDEEITPGSPLYVRVTVHTTLRAAPYVIDVYEDRGRLIATSSANPGIHFKLDPEREFIKLYQPRDAFLDRSGR